MNKIIKKLSEFPVKSLLCAKFFADLVCVIIGYKLFPYLLNYPPDSINTPFQLSVNPYYYNFYYFSIFLIGIVVDLIIAYNMLKPLKKTKSVDEIHKARKVCYKYPSKSLIITTFIMPLILIIGMLLITRTNFILTIKIAMLAIIFIGVPNLVLYFLSTNVLKEVLIRTFSKEVYETEKVKKTNLYSKMLVEIFSTVTISMILIFMFITANVSNEIADYRFETYKEKLDTIIENAKSQNIAEYELYDFLNTNLKDDNWFYEINDSYSGNTEISTFMKNYIKWYSDNNGGRTYDYYGVSLQGVVEHISINNQDIIIGITYTIPSDLFYSLLLLIAGFLAINYIIIFLSSKTIGYNLDDINNGLENILNRDKIELDLLPITSTDEIGRLTNEINLVQEKTNQYIGKIEQDQYTMQRQAQFSIIGEFAGGLAHDLNSPLSAVKLDISTLRKYINSNKVQADDSVIAKLNEMFENIDNSLNSMGNIIMGVRNQIRATGDSDKEEFSFLEVIDGIKILFRSILMKNNCQLEVNVSENIRLYGEKNKLDRVIGNLIKNAIDAYVENGIKGIVKVSAEVNDSNTIIAVKDEAGGIDDSVKDNIFKEIKTTKKENGTGFGLYYSNTIIESSFKGKMYFETEKGVGSTFYIEIPNNKEEK